MQRLLRQFLYFATVAALASVPASAQVSRRPPLAGAIDAVFKRYDSNRTPGCSVAVIEAGKVVFEKSYGMADPALGVPMTSSTASWIPYSEARVFVGLAVAMLAKDGMFTLDDPVRRHVPEVPSYADAVTIRQLLHHTSGLADYGTLAGPGFELSDRLSEDEFFRILSRWGNLGFVPGADQMYSNTDYALLKILIERASGGSFHDYLSQKLLRPNGMTATRIGFNQSQVVPGHALFHESDGDGYRRLLRYRISPVGTISVTTNLDDLIRFEQALRDPRQGLRAMLNQLENDAPPPPNVADDTSYSFGVEKGALSGFPVLKYHGVGDFTYLVQLPTADLSIATLCNTYQGMDSFAVDVARLYASPEARVLAETQPRTAGAAELAQTVVVPPGELQAYVGHYQDTRGAAAVEVAVTDGRLTITPRGRPSFPTLRPVGSGRFVTSLGGIPFALQFDRVENDMVLTSWDLAANESGGAPLRRTAVLRPTAETLQPYAGVYVGENVDITMYVRQKDGRLLLATSGYAESELSATQRPDEFRLPDIYTAKFEREASGEVAAVVLNASRVKGMRFRRAQ
ncbi:serine hydrolase [Parafrankia sp. BMG5.11]|uniref:serine hydrolase domain-containing protein n=1 Tax=Parafrankia sp. BMG5.11 TaxID=222540 RepID=UPI00103E1ECA|nr:serine hydrolase domain-containing protein [Parafrankia sp. BMG5.11]TCJ38835.1 class A beta-lactamase-related serine hydrolase [Parafrankia sp. BMG5.11]